MKLVCLAEIFFLGITFSNVFVVALVREKDLLSIPRPSDGCWDIKWASLEDLVESSVCKSTLHNGQNAGTFNFDTLTCQTSFVHGIYDFPGTSNEARVLEKIPEGSPAKAVWIDINGKEKIPRNALFIGKHENKYDNYVARINPGPRVRVGRLDVENDASLHGRFWYQDFDTKIQSSDKFQVLLCKE